MAAGAGPRPTSIAYAQPRGPRPLRQGGFETRPYVNPDPCVVLQRVTLPADALFDIVHPTYPMASPEQVLGRAGGRRVIAMLETDKVFAGSIPESYDRYMVPLIFERF